MFSGVAAPSAGGRLLGRILLTGRTPRMLPDVGAVARGTHSGLPARVPSQHGDAGLTLEAPSSWATRPGPSLKKKTDTWRQILRARGESVAAGPAHAAIKSAF